MEKIYFAQKAFIVDDNKLLMIQKSDKDKLNPNKWEVPGGKLEFGETIEENILREVKEEVGIDIEIGEVFDIWQWQFTQDEDKKQIIAAARFCKPLNKNITSNFQVESDNISQIKWIPIDEILNYEIMPNMLPTVKKFINLQL